MNINSKDMKRTKSIIAFLLVFIIMGSSSVNAQDKEKQEKARKMDRAEVEKALKARKIAYIAEYVELTPEEAEKFWPLYNQFENKRLEVTKDMFKHFERGHEKPMELSDENADRIIRDRFNEEQALLDLKVRYHEKFLDVLPASRVLMLYEAENNFKRRLLQRTDTPWNHMKEQSRDREGRDGSREKPSHDKQDIK